MPGASGNCGGGKSKILLCYLENIFRTKERYFNEKPQLLLYAAGCRIPTNKWFDAKIKLANHSNMWKRLPPIQKVLIPITTTIRQKRLVGICICFQVGSTDNWQTGYDIPKHILFPPLTSIVAISSKLSLKCEEVMSWFENLPRRFQR